MRSPTTGDIYLNGMRVMMRLKDAPLGIQASKVRHFPQAFSAREIPKMVIVIDDRTEDVVLLDSQLREAGRIHSEVLRNPAVDVWGALLEQLSAHWYRTHPEMLMC